MLTGLILLGTGLALNQFKGQQGTLRLREGQQVGLALNSDATEDEETEATDSGTDTLGYVLTLDSLSIRPFTPEYHIEVWQKDDSESQNATMNAAGMYSKKVDAFDLQPMKIHKIGDSQFRFRLSTFYPNFQFTYAYPENRDTLQPVAPGITLELHIPGQEPLMATMLSDQPSRSKLDDVVGLGCSLAFYWTLPADTLAALTASTAQAGARMVFVGETHKMYFLQQGTSQEQPLNEQQYYPLPGKDSAGIKVLFCYPDASLLKAVPSTRGEVMRNPVAAIEYWPLGGRYQEAYIYPESATKKGGAFTVPGTSYRLILATDQALANKYCDCQLTFARKGGADPEPIALRGGASQSVHGYRFTPVECSKGHSGMLVLEVAKMPGRMLFISGLVLMGISVMLYLLGRISYFSKTAG